MRVILFALSALAFLAGLFVAYAGKPATEVYLLMVAVSVLLAGAGVIDALVNLPRWMAQYAAKHSAKPEP